MGFSYTSKPAWWANTTTTKRYNWFSAGDTLTFTLSQATATSYTVRDYWGTVVASGAVSGTTLTLAALPAGWYRLWLDRVTSDATWGTAAGETAFAVLPVDARFPSYALGGSASVGFDYDWKLLGMAGWGPGRINADASAPAAALDTANANSYWSGNGYIDSARSRPLFMSFPNGITGNETGAGTIVAANYPTVTYYEGPSNEPSAAGATLVTAVQAFYNTIKAGNASAKVLAPCLVSVGGGRRANAATGLTQLRGFFAAGGGAYCDGISVHLYNNTNGDPALIRDTLDELTALLATFGQSTKPIFVTEHGFTNGICYGLFQPRSQAHWWLLQTLLLEQYGIPKEQIAYYYQVGHGYWDFPSFVLTEDGWTLPLPVLMRTFAAEVYGKAFTRKLTFGVHGDEQYVGSLYTDAGTGAKTAVLMSAGRTDGSLTFTATGSTVTQVTCFGVTTTLPVTAGQVTVLVGKEPVYLRLTAGQTLTEPTVDYGQNRTLRLPDRLCATVTSGLTATAGSDPSTTVDGYLRKSFYTNNYPSVYQADAALPATFEVDLLNLEGVNRIVVHCLPPWSTAGALTDFDVQWWDGAAWQTAATVTEPAVSLPRQSPTQGANSTAETYYSDRWQFNVTFPTVRTTKIRLYIRAATYGGNVDAAAQAAGGQGSASPRVTLRQIEVFGPTSPPAGSQHVVTGVGYLAS